VRFELGNTRQAFCEEELHFVSLFIGFNCCGFCFTVFECVCLFSVEAFRIACLSFVSQTSPFNDHVYKDGDLEVVCEFTRVTEV
jgi:hypothetical protein